MPGQCVKTPIAVISFDRPDYLRQVLDSLSAQDGGVDGSCLHLFQDGHHSFRRGRDVADPASIEACIAAFRAVFPEGHVHLARRNLGVAGNLGRAERYLLGHLRAPVAYFFEDDLVLAPHYLQALDVLAGFALADERIGYVAAYGDHRAPPGADPSSLVPMEHNWGFALTRRHWLEQQPILRAYRALLAGHDYRDRPHRAIFEFFWALGTGAEGTSQDCARQVACRVLGRVRLRCTAVLARNIGRVGLHMTPNVYDTMRYGEARLWTGPPPALEPPGDALIHALIAEDRAAGQALLGVDSSPPVLNTPAPLRLPNVPLDHDWLVRLLYRGLLNRDPDPDGLRHALQALDSGQLRPEQLVRSFVDSEEFRRHHGR